MSRQHIVSPSERASVRDLEIIARTTVEGLRQGLHRSPFHGYSAEFSQYRHYRPGDDLKYVDWKAFGRTDRLYTRQFRETTNLAALFVIDISRSMAFPVPEPAGGGRRTVSTKLALAKTTAAVLAALVIDQGDTAGLLAVDQATVYLPPRSGRHHLHLVFAALSRLEASTATPVSAALVRAGRIMRRRGLIVLLTDLYDEESTLAEVRRLSRSGHEVVVVHVLAPQEMRLAGAPAGEFVDLETGAALVIDPAAAAARYDEAFSTFLSRVAHAVRREGLDYVRLVAGEPLEPSLRRFLVARRSRG